MKASDWDERFSGELPYGLEPNDFLREEGDRIPPGPVLCLAEGYGRNALWLAARGHAVTAAEQSTVGVARGKALAAERGRDITWVQGDLADLEMGEGKWSGIVSIFAHLPPDLRADVHRRVVRALAPGGVFILEAYSPAQLGHRTGGPRQAELLMTREGLLRELEGLEFELAREIERDVTEGTLHSGVAAVVQVVGRRLA
ncbi:MAG TPA: class I SAM-dependent methyltransferase [Gemmatimonadaceae bacterium]|nr:class I SAM-dependent methyltransferase [Gemmatimonadaceae bacterium]